MNYLLDEFQVDYTEIRTIQSELEQNYSNGWDWLTGTALILGTLTIIYVSFKLGRKYEKKLKNRRKKKIDSKQFWDYYYYLQKVGFKLFQKQENLDDANQGQIQLMKSSSSHLENIGIKRQSYSEDTQMLQSTSYGRQTSKYDYDESMRPSEELQENLIMLKQNQKGNGSGSKVIPFQSLDNSDISNGQVNDKLLDEVQKLPDAVD